MNARVSIDITCHRIASINRSCVIAIREKCRVIWSHLWWSRATFWKSIILPLCHFFPGRFGPGRSCNLLLLLLGCYWAATTRLSCCDRAAVALHPCRSDRALAAALLRHTRVQSVLPHHQSARSPADLAADFRNRASSDSRGVHRAASWAGAAGAAARSWDCVFQRASTCCR